MGCSSSSTRVAPTLGGGGGGGGVTPEGRSSREYTVQTVDALSPSQQHQGTGSPPPLLVSPLPALPSYDDDPVDKPSPLDGIAKALEAGGVMGVLGLLRDKEGNSSSSSDFAWWALDAIAGLMSGDGVSREEFFKGGGLDTLLDTLETFPYVEEVQTRGCWVLAALASDHGEQVGEAGGVEAALAALTACPESYQVTVAVTRALSNLCSAPPPSGPLNVARVVAGGGMEALHSRLEENPSDGQLQWRGAQLMKKLKAAAAAAPADAAPAFPAAAAPASPGAAATPTAGTPATTSRRSTASTRSHPSSRLVMERTLASSSSLASSEGEGVGGGASRRVVELGEKGGLIAVVQHFTQLVKAMLVESSSGLSTPSPSTQFGEVGGSRSSVRSWATDALRTPLGEEAYWCSDYIFSALREDRAGRDLAVECKVTETLGELMQMAVGRQDDKQVTLGLWVLQTLAGEYSLQVGALIPQLLGCLSAMKTSLVVQQAGIKLLASLVGEASGTNLKTAQDANATAIVKAIVASTTSDPQLQYRGVNLLEKLEPGSTSTMPKQASFRSTSMRADEMVRFIRSSAGEYVARGSPMGSSQRFRESLRGGGIGMRTSPTGGGHSTPLLMSSPPPLMAHMEEDDPKGEEEEEEEEEGEGEGVKNGAG